MCNRLLAPKQAKIGRLSRDSSRSRAPATTARSGAQRITNTAPVCFPGPPAPRIWRKSPTCF